MKLWEKCAQAQIEKLREREAEIEVDWMEFAASGYCTQNSITCENCPFLGADNMCCHKSDEKARQRLNEEVEE